MIDIYERLRAARNAGEKDGGIKRLSLLADIMDLGYGEHKKWTVENGRSFMKALINRCVLGERRDILLASAGITDKYREFTSAMQRRTEYIEDNRPCLSEATLKTYENQELKKIAQIFEKRSHLIRELIETEVLGATQEATRINGELKTDKRIIMIGEQDDNFVGREKLLLEIHKGFFDEGHKVQAIGGFEQKGKTRLTLHYAETHKDQYQIICLINAFSPSAILSSAVDFLAKAGANIKDTTEEAIIQLFLDFFCANDRWLLVVDNASPFVAAAWEYTKRILPNGDGHILVVGECFEKTLPRDWKLFTLGMEDRSFEREDAYTFLRRRLHTGKLDKHAEKLIEVSNYDISFLTSATELMKISGWITPEIYVHLLEDYGIAECESGSPYYVTAAQINYDYLMITWNANRDNRILSALNRLLFFLSFFRSGMVDLAFLSSTFPILPDEICQILVQENEKKELFRFLKLMGLFEISQGVFMVPSVLERTIKDRGDHEKQIGTLAVDTKRKIEQQLARLKDNDFISNPMVVEIKAQHCIETIDIYASLFSGNQQLQGK